MCDHLYRIMRTVYEGIFSCEKFINNYSYREEIRLERDQTLLVLELLGACVSGSARPHVPVRTCKSRGALFSDDAKIDYYWGVIPQDQDVCWFQISVYQSL